METTKRTSKQYQANGNAIKNGNSNVSKMKDASESAEIEAKLIEKSLFSRQYPLSPNITKGQLQTSSKPITVKIVLVGYVTTSYFSTCFIL